MKYPNQFKEGNPIYCPTVTHRICQVKFMGVDKLRIDEETPFQIYTNGCNPYHMPVIFHATQENYELLSKLYPNVAFEPPPKRKEPREIIKAMFDSGKWFLVNYRGYGKLGNPPKNKTVTKEQFEKLDMNGYFDKNAYANVEVFCPNTGKTIIDFVNGEVILEN